jgi:hypothetical protein
MMDLRPWGYWMPTAARTRARRRCRAARGRHRAHPRHPGALHFYIHLMEPTDPPRPRARRRHAAHPDAGRGHMVHMPSHIYQRVGRYADAVRSNELAVLADEDYITQCRAQGLYPMGYYPHNIHFLWWAATFEGRARLRSSRRARWPPRSTTRRCRDADAGRLPRGPVLRAHALRALGRDAARAGTPRASRFSRACGTTCAALRSWRRARSIRPSAS